MDTGAVNPPNFFPSESWATNLNLTWTLYSDHSYSGNLMDELDKKKNLPEFVSVN